MKNILSTYRANSPCQSVPHRLRIVNICTE
nr:MAG TPA: hypothetical protein [Caudoviricetes sp.]